MIKFAFNILGDGVDRTMGAFTTVHSVEHGDNIGDVSFPVIQKIFTRGAHGADYFSMVQRSPQGNFIGGLDFITIPNYYYCERDSKCNATALYQWDILTHQFYEVATIPSSGPGQTDHFTNSYGTFIIIAENFANRLSIYRVNATIEKKVAVSMQKVVVSLHQMLELNGVASCAIAQIDGIFYLIGASYHDRGW
jgi:hypothetical protein